MSNNYFSVNGLPDPRVTISNALNGNVPSTVTSAVSVDGSPGITVVQQGNPRWSGFLSSTANNYFEANYMAWAQDAGTNGLYDITSGSGNDTIILNRSAIGHELRTNDGDDKLVIDNGYVYHAFMGAGNDEVVLKGERTDVSQEELDAKAGAVGNNINKMIQLNGESGEDTLRIERGEWTVTLNSQNITFKNNQVTNVFTSDNYSLIDRFPSVGTTLSGTIQFPNYTAVVNGATASYESKVVFWNFEHILVICFTADCMIDTPKGEVPITSLEIGDIVHTRHGPKPLKWIGKRKLEAVDLAGNPKMVPVRVPQGAFGHGLPTRDVHFSPQHRVVIRSKIAQNMFGSHEVMAAVKQLIGVNGIEVDHDLDEVVYYHLMFDTHTTVSVGGIEAETLYPGRQALASMSDYARKELVSIFPELQRLADKEAEDNPQIFEPLMPLLPGRSARALAARHAKKALPLYAPREAQAAYASPQLA